MFLLRTRAGRRLVVKRSDAPWSEVSAAAVGRAAGVRTVPARPLRRSEWCMSVELPFDGAPDEVLIVMPWVEAPTLAAARTPFSAHALGRLWAFDVLIDNSDRLVKGGNPSNLLVASNGSLHALDQRLGPAARGEVDAARVTRRRLLAASTGEQRRALADRIAEDFRNEAGVSVPSGFASAFSRGVVAGVRSIASLRPKALRQAVAAAGARGHVSTRGFAPILRAFREAAA